MDFPAEIQAKFDMQLKTTIVSLLVYLDVICEVLTSTEIA